MNRRTDGVQRFMRPLGGGRIITVNVSRLSSFWCWRWVKRNALSGQQVRFSGDLPTCRRRRCLTQPLAGATPPWSLTTVVVRARHAKILSVYCDTVGLLNRLPDSGGFWSSFARVTGEFTRRQPACELWVRYLLQPV